MRNAYNLSHLAHIVGHIGRLQTVSVIPVTAGDSLEVHLDGVFRLAPFRKEIVSECQVDIMAFYVKHRHVWPTQWPAILTEGLQTGTSLPVGVTANAGSRDPFYLGIKECGALVNKSLVYGYNQIYRRFFAVPATEQNGTFAYANVDTFYPNGATSDLVNTRKYGMRAARLPHILNGMTVVNEGNAGGYIRNYSSDDWGVNIPDGTTPDIGLLDIRDLQQIMSRYKAIQEQNYFSAFYDDVIAQKWDTSGVNTDADPRPDMLGRSTQFVSGHDVDGTDDATLGSFVGKTVARVDFRIPRRFFPEHGNVWIMILPRFPLVHTKEQHPLLYDSTPDLKLLLADPTVIQGEPVVPFTPGDWIAGGSIYTPNIDQTQQPYGQELRYQPNRIHPVFEAIPGYPFTQWDTANYYDWYYYKDNEYADVFQTSQVGQWQTHANVKTVKYSTMPGVTSSIMAGS